MSDTDDLNRQLEESRKQAEFDAKFSQKMTAADGGDFGKPTMKPTHMESTGHMDGPTHMASTDVSGQTKELGRGALYNANGDQGVHGAENGRKSYAMDRSKIRAAFNDREKDREKPSQKRSVPVFGAIGDSGFEMDGSENIQITGPMVTGNARSGFVIGEEAGDITLSTLDGILHLSGKNVTGNARSGFVISAPGEDSAAG